MSTGEPLAVICRSAPDRFPAPETWSKWCAEDAELGIRHGRARDAGYDSIAQDCMSIADSNIDDVYCAADGEERTNSDVIQRAKLRVETRLKLLAKWDPRRYGDKMIIDQTNRVAPMTPEQMTEEMSQSPAFRAEIAEMLARSANA